VLKNRRRHLTSSSNPKNQPNFQFPAVKSSDLPNLGLNTSGKPFFMRNITCLCLLVLLLQACDPIPSSSNGGSQVYVPVYVKAENLSAITVQSAKVISRPGKVYVKGNLLLQNDVNTGVHFIDISNPAQPVKLAFLNVPFSTEMSIKDNFLYVNNFNDLLVFNISNPSSPALVKRMENVFPYPNSEYPPVSNTYFECVDPRKGIVVDWKLADVTDPKCRR
jgi:hypothetical protein